jgi:hypothetical protein
VQFIDLYAAPHTNVRVQQHMPDGDGLKPHMNVDGSQYVEKAAEAAPEYQASLGDPIHSNAQGPTEAINKYQDCVLSDKQGDRKSFKVLKELGRGGFGVVSLCQRIGHDVRPLVMSFMCKVH